MKRKMSEQNMKKSKTETEESQLKEGNNKEKRTLEQTVKRTTNKL